jgi:hypothetical protein
LRETTDPENFDGYEATAIRCQGCKAVHTAEGKFDDRAGLRFRVHRDEVS